MEILAKTQAGIATLQISSKNLKIQVNLINNPNCKLTEEAERWQSVLQLQLCLGAPRVLVVMGKRANKHLLEHLKHNGLQCPPTEKIPSYAYIMTKPDNKLKLGPRHPARIENYKLRIADIAAPSFVQMRVIFFKCCKQSDQLENALTVPMKLDSEKARQNYVGAAKRDYRKIDGSC